MLLIHTLVQATQFTSMLLTIIMLLEVVIPYNSRLVIDNSPGLLIRGKLLFCFFIGNYILQYSGRCEPLRKVFSSQVFVSFSTPQEEHRLPRKHDKTGLPACCLTKFCTPYDTISSNLPNMTYGRFRLLRTHTRAIHLNLYLNCTVLTSSFQS